VDQAGFQPLGLVCLGTQGVALGWDDARLWRWVRTAHEFGPRFQKRAVGHPADSDIEAATT